MDSKPWRSMFRGDDYLLSAMCRIRVFDSSGGKRARLDTTSGIDS
jgi:hypothetical protein